METSEIDRSEIDASHASELFGQTQGALVLVGAGFAWMIGGLSGLDDVPVTALLAVIAVAALLTLFGFRVRRSAPGLSDPPRTPHMRRVFVQAFVGENIGIVLIVIGALLLHRPLWIPPLIALAVGLHFFPLAGAFRRPLYWVTGAALCLVCGATIVFVPAHLDGRHLNSWRLAAGLGSGAVLWLSATWMLAQSSRGLKRFARVGRLAIADRAGNS